MVSSAVFDRPALGGLQQKAQWLALVLLAIGLHVFEASLPSLGPWFKPGLANIVTLVCLAMLGARAAMSMALARVVVGSLLIGTFLTPTFVLSLSGAVAAATVMSAAWRLPGIGLIGVSLLGALAHMVAQFAVAEALFVRHAALYYLLPPLLFLSCLSGWLNGALAVYVVARVRPVFGSAHA